MRILVIEDDKALFQTIRDELKKDYIVEGIHSGKKGEYQAQANEYDLIVLDIVLPDISGIQVCYNLRTAGISTPILILTGKSDVDDKVAGLTKGADDYLTKPFDFKELRARIQALLRRQGPIISHPVLSLEHISLDTDQKVVKREDKEILLRRKEFDLLEYFMRNPGKVLTRGMILEHVWDSSYESVANIVDVHVNYLREKIDRPFRTKLIKTIYGLGYKFEPDRKEVKHYEGSHKNASYQ